MRRKATDYLASGDVVTHVSGKYAEANGLPLKIRGREGLSLIVKDPNMAGRGVYHLRKAALPVQRRLLRWIKRI